MFQKDQFLAPIALDCSTYDYPIIGRCELAHLTCIARATKGKAVEIGLMKNIENVRLHRRDIAQALGRTWDEEEMMTNDSYIGRLFGEEVAQVNHLGLLNRGFCPLCGINLESNDIQYSRKHRFSDAREFLCKECYVRANPFSNPEYVAAHHKARLFVWATVLVILAIIGGLGYGIFRLVASFI
jgi:hypothetical protein